MKLPDRLISWALAESSAVPLALFRIVTGLMVIRHLLGYARDWSTQGFYGATFYMPYANWIPQPTETIYLCVLALGILSAAFLIVGYKTRTAAIICCLMVAYHLSLNEIWYRHNRYFLALSVFLLCFSPCGNALSIDATRLKLPPIGPAWTSFLIKVQMTLIYLASATSKTLDTGWRSGDVLIGRRLGPLWETVVPDFVTRLIPPDTAVRMMTTQALMSEFFLATFVWFRRTRRLAIWWGIYFHGFIEVQYSVLAFTYLTLGTYFLFADLKCGEKVWIYSEQRAFHRFIARLLPFMDWLFQIRLAKHSGRGHQFIDRDGTVYRGWLAWIMISANIPITFIFCYPLSWLRFLRWGRSREPFESIAVPSTQCSASWMVTWLSLYLVFLAAFNLYAPWRLLPEMRRFWDLPWFFVLMCLMAGAYHRSMVRAWIFPSANEQPEPERSSTPLLAPSRETVGPIAHAAPLRS